MVTEQQQITDFVNTYISTEGYPDTKTYTNNGHSVELVKEAAAILDIIQKLNTYNNTNGQMGEFGDLDVTMDNVRELLQVGKDALFDVATEQEYGLISIICPPEIAF